MVPLLPLLCCYCERQAPIVEEQAPSSQPYMSPFVGGPAAMVTTPNPDTPSMWSFPAPPADSEAVPLTGTTVAAQPVAGAEGTPAGSATGSAPRQAGPEAELDPFPGVVFPEVPMGTPAPPQPLPAAFRQALPASLPMHFAPVGVTVDGTPGVASEVRGVGANFKLNHVASGGPPPPPPPPLPVAPWLHQPAGLPEAGIHTSALAASSSSSSTTTTGAGASGRDDGALLAVAPAPQASAGREGDSEVLLPMVGAVGDSLAGPGASVGPTGYEDSDAAVAAELSVPARTQQ